MTDRRSASLSLKQLAYLLAVRDTLNATEPRNGRWQPVVVDDLIPCAPLQPWEERATPLFAKPQGGELWVLLLEKAVAKLAGSYAALISGSAACVPSTTGPQLMRGAKGGRAWAPASAGSAFASKRRTP